MPCTHALAARLPAFEQLYARHRGKLYRYLLRQLRDNGLADELFQDIWQRVVSARTGWKPDAGFATWLYTIAHHRLGDHWRSLKHRPATPGDADELARCIVALANEVLLLRLEQELTLEEIGEVTGVGRETVKSRLRYAMDKLRAVMPA